MKSKSNFWKEFIKALIISVVLAMVIRAFLVQPFKVQGASMEPTFVSNDYLIIDEISYRFREPKRDEVIVFRHGSAFFIKRIDGLPGETVEVQGKELVLTEDEYFVLGDNRDASSDSRSWGPVQEKDIVGRAWLQLLPLTKIKKL